MVKHLGLRAGDYRFIESIPGRLDVVLHLFAGHLERAAIITKPVSRHRVLGDVLNVVDVEPQQVPHRVLVLFAREPAKDDLSAFALVDFVGVIDGGIEPIQNNFALFGSEVLFVIRWHFTQVDHAPDIMPGFGGPVLDHVGREGIETNLALLLLLTVTAEAFCLEYGSHLIFVAFRSLRRLGLGGQRAAKHQEQR